jgi:hypothetical protein
LGKPRQRRLPRTVHASPPTLVPSRLIPDWCTGHKFRLGEGAHQPPKTPLPISGGPSRRWGRRLRPLKPPRYPNSV